MLWLSASWLVDAGRSSGGSGSYELKASFRSVEGVTVGTDVRLAGVKVGTVTSLALNSKTYFADATLSVREGGGSALR